MCECVRGGGGRVGLLERMKELAGSVRELIWRGRGVGGRRVQTAVHADAHQRRGEGNRTRTPPARGEPTPRSAWRCMRAFVAHSPCEGAEAAR